MEHVRTVVALLLFQILRATLKPRQKNAPGVPKRVLAQKSAKHVPQTTAWYGK